MTEQDLHDRAVRRTVRMDRQRRWEMGLIVALVVLVLASLAALWLAVASVSRTVDQRVDERNRVFCDFLEGLPPSSRTPGLIRLHDSIGCLPPLGTGQ